MSDLAGMGPQPWLPVSVQRAQAAEEQREAKEAREAEARRAEVAEQRHEAALACYRSMAEERGEIVSPLALAQGAVSGRSVADVLAGAEAASNMEDARQRAREAREGPFPPVHVNFDEPVIVKPLSTVGRSIANRNRRFFAAVEARRVAEAAEARAHEDFPQTVRRSSQRSTVDAEAVYRAACAEIGMPLEDEPRRVSYRSGFGAGRGEMSRVVDAGFRFR